MAARSWCWARAELKGSLPSLRETMAWRVLMVAVATTAFTTSRAPSRAIRRGVALRGESAAVGFSGEAGSAGEVAAVAHFGSSARTVACRSLEEMFVAVEKKEIAFGMLPVENSLTGGLNKAFDLLLQHDLKIFGETCLRHEDDPTDFTRYVIVSMRDAAPPMARPKTSLAFAVIDRPGALAAALGEFGRRGINILKIESRPRRRTTGPGFFYVFFLGFEGTLSDANCAAAVKGLLDRSAFVRFLGSYDAAPPVELQDAAVRADPALLQI